jgi:hypothetical protein
MVDIVGIVSNPAFYDRVIAFVVTGILAIIGRKFTPKAKVVWGTSHGFSFTVPKNNNNNGPYTFHTGTVFIQNVGRDTATDIEVHFNFRPEHFQIWPAFSWKEETNPEGHYAVVIKNLGKREFVTIEMISGIALPLLLRVRTAKGECRQVQMAPQQVFSRGVRWILIGLLLLGIFALVQNLIGLVRL